MENKKILILTGQIASGKSTAKKWFKSMGLPTIDADMIVHDAYKTPNSPIWNSVYSMYGTKVLDREEISRKKLRELINTKEDLLKLENAVTTLVRDEMLVLTNKLDSKEIIWEVPLYKKGWFDLADVLVVLANEQCQERNFMSRPNNKLDALDVIRGAQPSRDEYIEMATFLVNNNGTLEQFYSNLNYTLKMWRLK